MADRIVVGYLGDRESLAQTVRASAACGLDVVAVAFDLGGKTALTALRDDALTLGAIRCHALDVREEFARDVIVPALAAVPGDLHAVVTEAAERFVGRSLASIATLEAATFVEPGRIDLPWRTRIDRRDVPGTAIIKLRFAHDTPIELNGITMTPAEILESLATITAQPAIDVLHTAYQDLPGSPDGIVELAVADGRIDVMSRLVAS